MELSKEQSAAVSAIADGINAEKPHITLCGYAGSGKSTIIPYIIEESPFSMSEVAFVTFTGKASQVLRSKLGEAGVAHQAGYVGTIHGLIYTLIDEKKTGEMVWTTKPQLLGKDDNNIRLIVVDEASMVGEKMLEDLKRYDVQILAVGDPAQLPPVQDRSVLLSPTYTLREVHRQAKDNPIVRIATAVRETGKLPGDVPRIKYQDADECTAELAKLDWAVLTRSNRARCFFNRQLCGNSPKAGHPVICLKNDWPKGVYNGLRGVLEEVPTIGPNTLHANLQIDFPDAQGSKIIKDVNMKQFLREKAYNRETMGKEHDLAKVGVLMDFGSAMTVHKAQGSGFHTVLISPEEWKWNKTEKGDWQKWLYTAITRATDKLYFLPNWN